MTKREWMISNGIWTPCDYDSEADEDWIALMKALAERFDEIYEDKEE